MALLVASQYVLPGYGLVQGPGWPDHLCWVIAAYALRFNSRADTEGSIVSSLLCDRTWNKADVVYVCIFIST